MLAVAVLLIVARVAGSLAHGVRQPRVIGEVVAGVVVGPAILGSIAPGMRSYVLPPEVSPLLAATATLGLVLFMFLTGVEAAEGRDVGDEPWSSRTLLIVSVFNFGLPFAAGLGVAAALAGPFAAGVRPEAFFLFIGVAVGVSALPVLARILQDRGALGGSPGRLAIAAAATGDIAAWSVLGLAIGLARQGSTGPAVWPIAAAAFGMLALSFGLVARPSTQRTAFAGMPKSGRLVTIIASILLASFVTEAAGIGLIFGPFLLGIVVARVFPRLTRDVTDLSLVPDLLLPLYFVETGARADVRLLGDPGLVPIGLLILSVAIASKLGASLIAAKLAGLRFGDGLTLGIMLNTRGLTELVVLNLGMSAGIISAQLFTLFVAMALVTTSLTGPMLDVVERHRDRPSPSMTTVVIEDEVP